jgi:hypothetical protein
MVAKKYVGLQWLCLVLGLLLGAPLASRAQIVDDSTKVVYGPKNTRVIYEREVLHDSVSGTPIDTSLVRWPQERYWLHDTTFQQDLGALGTASRPLLYAPNLELGARFGRNVFDRNTHDASRVPYYDSRAPYSFFRFIQGSAGEQVFEINYSRSLKKNFSVGVNYERIAANQVLATGGNQWLVEHNNFTLYSRFQSENDRYHLLFNYSASRQRTREQGGIFATPAQRRALGELAPQNPIPENTVYADSLYRYGDERVYLNSARNVEDRDQVHIFQTYRLLGRGLTAYHVLDVRRQFNGYTDESLPRDGNGRLIFYPIVSGPNRGVYRNPTATNDYATYRQLENTIGFLGHTDRIEYRVYARRRDASLKAYSTTPGISGIAGQIDEVTSGTYGQVFVGGTASFNYRTIYSVEVDGEYLPYDNGAIKTLGINSEYWLRGRIRTGPLSAEVLTTAYSPTLTQQRFVGNHYQWPTAADVETDANGQPITDINGRTVSNLSKTNDFANTRTQQLTVRLQQKLPFLAEHSLEASASIVYITNLIYYNQLGLPQQLGDNKTLLIGHARHRFRVGSFHFDNEATYTRGGDGDGLRIPALVTNSRAYYQRQIFGRALFAQVGAEMYYQSRFRGYSYAPSTQQFYVQDRFTMQNFAVANVFVAADISSASIFLKVAYVNQGIPTNGYFTTPYYTGYPRRFQLGVRWKFFN